MMKVLALSRPVTFGGLNPSCSIAANVAAEKKQTPFPVLGDSAERDYPDIVKKERMAAGLDSVPEVKANRAWYYWMVSTPENKPLPLKLAKQLNSESGDTIRAFGYAGGLKGKDFLSWAKKGVTNWHVDTQEGLEKLVKVLQQFLIKK
jgi:hypothetical protein